MNKQQRWFYTAWVIAATVLYLGLLVLSQYLHDIDAHLWTKLLVHILKSVCVITGVFLFTDIMKQIKKDCTKQPKGEK